MLKMENKENETQQEDERASKLVAEPSGQKPRRSVLKEFDPLTPQSPCPPVPNKKIPPTLIDEDEIYEDAETSLTSFLCPRTKNLSNNIETLKNPGKISNGTCESLLPDLMDNHQDVVNPNDTTDLSYKEAVEDLSQVDLLSVDKTSSEEDVEFNAKRQTGIPEIVIQSSGNNLLSIITDVSNEGDIMVDSLEHTFVAGSNQLDTTTEGIQPSEANSNPISEPTLEAVIRQVEENSHDRFNTMIDSLELSGQQENIPISDSSTHEQNISHQEILIDSLEVLKSEENLQVSKPEDNTSKRQENTQDDTQNIPSSSAGNNHETPALDATFEGQPRQTEILVTGGTTHVTDSNIDSTAEMNQTFEAPEISATSSTLLDSKLDAICEAPSKESAVSICDSTNDIRSSNRETTDVNNANVNKTIEAVSKNIVKSEAELSLNDKSNAIETSKLDTTFEALPSQSEVPVVEDSVQSNTSVNMELNQTFETPSLDSIESKTNHLQSDQINDSKQIVEPEAALEINANQNEVPVVENEKVETVKNDKLDDVGSPDETKDVTEKNSVLNHNKTELQTIASDIPKGGENNTDSPPHDETFDTPLSKTGSSVAGSLDNKVISDDTELSKVFEYSSEIAESPADQTVQTCDQATKPGHIPTQSIINEGAITQNHPVSLKDIINTDTSVKDDASPNDVEETSSGSQVGASFVINPSEDINSTYNKEEQAAESSIEMEALAQSLNQTIDVEESAIADDINSSKSTDSSKDSSREALNITIENIKEGLGSDEAVTEDKGGIKSAEDVDQPKNNKVLKRKDTEEFENIEKQCNEKAKEVVVGREDVIEKTREGIVDTVVEQDYNKVYLRQDTEEFEDLERECKEDMQDTNDSDVREVYQRQDTQEFEDLERKCKAEVQTNGDLEAQEVKSHNSVPKSSDEVKEENIDIEMSVMNEKWDTIINRQEDEGIERKYKENLETSKVQNISDLGGQKASDKSTPKSNNEVKEENISFERPVMDEKGNKIIMNREAEEFDDLEHKHKANKAPPNDLSDDGSKLTQENTHSAEVKSETKNAGTSVEATQKVTGEIVVENTDISVKPVSDQVKVKVSGNICNATSVSEVSDRIETKVEVEQKPFAGINLKYDIVHDKENRRHSNVDQRSSNQNSIEVTMNGKNGTPSNKTDLTETEMEQGRMVVANEQVPQTSENVAKPKRPECRPGTRSMRNKTQVIDRPVLISDSNVVSNDCTNEQLNEYKTKSDELKSEVDRLHSEIKTIKAENMRKDMYILTCALDMDVQKETNLRLGRLIDEYERVIAKQNGDLERLRQEAEKNAKHFTSSEMAFADVFEKYEKTKSVIAQYTRNEAVLQKNIQSAEDQLTKLEAKCSVMKEQFTQQLKKAQEQVMQEKEKYRQDISKLQAKVKRLEIKASSLETALKQKTEECRALSALCDDITGKQM